MDKFKNYINKLIKIHNKYGKDIDSFYIDCYESLRIHLKNGNDIIVDTPSGKYEYIDYEKIRKAEAKEKKKIEQKAINHWKSKGYI